MAFSMKDAGSGPFEAKPDGRRYNGPGAIPRGGRRPDQHPSMTYRSLTSKGRVRSPGDNVNPVRAPSQSPGQRNGNWQEGYKHELQPPAAHLGRQQAHPGLGVPPGLGQSRKVGAPQGLGAPPGLRTPQSMGMQPQLGTAAGADKPTRAFPGSDHQSGDWDGVLPGPPSRNSSSGGSRALRPAPEQLPGTQLEAAASGAVLEHTAVEAGLRAAGKQPRGGDRREQVMIRTFQLKERRNGTLVNVVDGLELHSNVLDAGEQQLFIDEIREWQKIGAGENGKKGKLRGRTFSAPRIRRPGDGRITIQFGACYNYTRDNPGILPHEVVEPLPPLLRGLIERLVSWGILPEDKKPDSAIINIYEAGMCIPPHIDHHDFERPFVTLSLLSEQSILFGSRLVPEPTSDGKFMAKDCPSLSIPLPVGSCLVLKGNGADMAEHCVPAVTKQRISITLRRIGPKHAEAVREHAARTLGNMPSQLDPVGQAVLFNSSNARGAAGTSHTVGPATEVVRGAPLETVATTAARPERSEVGDITLDARRRKQVDGADNPPTFEDLLAAAEKKVAETEGQPAAERKSLSQTVLRLQAALAEQVSGAESASLRITALERQVGEKDEALGLAQTTIKELQAALADRARGAETAPLRITALERQVGDGEEALGLARTTIEELQGRLRLTEKTLEVKTAESLAFAETAGALRQEVISLAERLAAAQSDAQSAHGRADRLEAELRIVAERADIAHQARADMQLQLNAMAANVSAAEAEDARQTAARMAGDLERASAEVLLSAKKLTAAETWGEALAAEAAAAAHALEATDKAAQAFKIALAASELAREGGERVVGSLSACLALSDDALAATHQEAERCQADLSASWAETARLEGALASCEAALRASHADTARLEAALVSSEAALRAAEERTQVSEAGLAAAQRQAAAYKNQRDRADAALAAAQRGTAAPQTAVRVPRAKDAPRWRFTLWDTTSKVGAEMAALDAEMGEP